MLILLFATCKMEYKFFFPIYKWAQHICDLVVFSLFLIKIRDTMSESRTVFIEIVYTGTQAQRIHEELMYAFGVIIKARDTGKDISVLSGNNKAMQIPWLPSTCSHDGIFYLHVRGPTGREKKAVEAGAWKGSGLYRIANERGAQAGF